MRNTVFHQHVSTSYKDIVSLWGESFKMFSQGDAEFYLMSFTKAVDEGDEVYCARGLTWNESVR